MQPTGLCAGASINNGDQCCDQSTRCCGGLLGRKCGPTPNTLHDRHKLTYSPPSQCSTAQSSLVGCSGSIAAVSQRPAGVLVENRAAVEVIFTRRSEVAAVCRAVARAMYKSSSNKRYHRCRMDDVEHLRVLGLLIELDRMLVLPTQEAIQQTAP